MTPRQLNEWQRYANLERLGWDADNHCTARIVWAILQAHTTERLREERYLFRFVPPPTPEDYRQKAHQIHDGRNAALAARN